jgi:hypothetical protein
MDRSEWIGRLELLHSSVRGGATVSPGDMEWYQRARRILLDTSVQAQNITVIGDERPRNALRLERAVPVRFGGEGWTISATTCDLGIGGFCVQTSESVDGEHLEWVELVLPGMPLRVTARVVASGIKDGYARLSFAFIDPPPAVRAAVEDYILDQLLPRIVFWDHVLDRIRD